jgi:hypothetical protein
MLDISALPPQSNQWASCSGHLSRSPAVPCHAVVCRAVSRDRTPCPLASEGHKTEGRRHRMRDDQVQKPIKDEVFAKDDLIVKD